MRHETKGIDCYQLLEDLRDLQWRWERKITDLTQKGRGPWASCVRFAIEIARRRIEEDCPGSSSVELNALLAKWEKILEDPNSSSLPKSVKGIDFGIRLVIHRVRQHLVRSIPRKPPTSANGTVVPGDNKAGR